MFIGGAVVQWLRDGLGSSDRRVTSKRWPRRVPDSGGVYFVPAFAGLGAPHWDQYARGAIVGPDARHDCRPHRPRGARGHRVPGRRICSTPCRRMPARGLTELRVDGGAARNDLLMQFQADLLGVPVVRPQITETTALGRGVSGRAGGRLLEERR